MHLLAFCLGPLGLATSKGPTFKFRNAIIAVRSLYNARSLKRRVHHMKPNGWTRTGAHMRFGYFCEHLVPIRDNANNRLILMYFLSAFPDQMAEICQFGLDSNGPRYNESIQWTRVFMLLHLLVKIRITVCWGRKCPVTRFMRLKISVAISLLFSKDENMNNNI